MVNIADEAFYGAEKSSLFSAINVAMEYWFSNSIHNDRDEFSNIVLQWGMEKFSNLKYTETALDIGSSHGISSAAIVRNLPHIKSVNAIDNAPGAIALGNYFVHNTEDIGGYKPEEFKSFLKNHEIIGKENIAHLLKNTRNKWKNCKGKINFTLQNVDELSQQDNHNFVYNAMGWHWAIKTGKGRKVLQKIKENMKDDAVFLTYTFGLADEYTMKTHPNADKYLTFSPVLRNFYKSLEEETNLSGLADALSEPSSPLFKLHDEKSELETFFSGELSDVQFSIFKYEASPHLLATMAKITTPNHLSLFALREDSIFFEGFQDYSKKENIKLENVVHYSIEKSYLNYKKNGLRKAINEHKEKGPYFELLPTVGGVLRS